MRSTKIVETRDLTDVHGDELRTVARQLAARVAEQAQQLHDLRNSLHIAALQAEIASDTAAALRIERLEAQQQLEAAQEALRATESALEYAVRQLAHERDQSQRELTALVEHTTRLVDHVAPISVREPQPPAIDTPRRASWLDRCGFGRIS